jgi:hypothetical protein
VINLRALQEANDVQQLDLGSVLASGVAKKNWLPHRALVHALADILAPAGPLPNLPQHVPSQPYRRHP